MADPFDSEITAEPADMKAASPAEAGTGSTAEITRPMLDVHAPHEAIHTWKNFFIHLATISIGLLIAIGLEQTVEYVHHRHQVAELMQKLRAETLENREILQTNLGETDRITSVVDDNLRSLAPGVKLSVVSSFPSWMMETEDNVSNCVSVSSNQVTCVNSYC